MIYGPAKKGLKLKRKRLESNYRKEVIQPHLPVQLPCYDFTPVMNHSLDACR